MPQEQQYRLRPLVTPQLPTSDEPRLTFEQVSAGRPKLPEVGLGTPGSGIGLPELPSPIPGEGGIGSRRGSEADTTGGPGSAGDAAREGADLSNASLATFPDIADMDTVTRGIMLAAPGSLLGTFLSEIFGPVGVNASPAPSIGGKFPGRTFEESQAIRNQFKDLQSLASKMSKTSNEKTSGLLSSKSAKIHSVALNNRFNRTIQEKTGITAATPSKAPSGFGRNRPGVGVGNRQGVGVGTGANSLSTGPAGPAINRQRGAGNKTGVEVGKEAPAVGSGLIGRPDRDRQGRGLIGPDRSRQGGGLR